jgi:WD40 repeat protein
MYYGLPATDVALNSSGQMLAIVDSGGLSVWDTNTKKPIFLLVIGSEIKKNYNTSSTTSVAIDRTGTWIAHANDNGTVEIEDREQNHIVWSVQIQDEGTPLALAFDTSRSRLAAVTSKSLTMWDLRGSTQNEALNAPLLDSPLASLAFSPDGSLLAVGTSNGWQVWSVADRKLLSENKRPTYAIAFSPDGRLFASGDALGVIHVWGLRNP